MRRLVPGMSAFRKSRALIQICMLARAVPAPAAEQTGSALYTLDAALTVTAKLSALPNGDCILWAGFTPETVLLSGENGSCTADLSVPGTITALPGGDAILADALLPWKNGGYAAFRHESAGQMALALYDSSLKKTAERTFGSDYSSTLESLQSYIALPEKNLLGFAADDSYCLYAEKQRRDRILPERIPD